MLLVKHGYEIKLEVYIFLTVDIFGLIFENFEDLGISVELLVFFNISVFIACF